MGEAVLCRIKAKYPIKPQDIVENSKIISLYSILSITNDGTKCVIFNLNYSEGSAVTDTAGV